MKVRYEMNAEFWMPEEPPPPFRMICLEGCMPPRVFTELAEAGDFAEAHCKDTGHSTQSQWLVEPM